jgi:hypothetical protein
VATGQRYTWPFASAAARYWPSGVNAIERTPELLGSVRVSWGVDLDAHK